MIFAVWYKIHSLLQIIHDFHLPSIFKCFSVIFCHFVFFVLIPLCIHNIPHMSIWVYVDFINYSISLKARNYRFNLCYFGYIYTKPKIILLFFILQIYVFFLFSLNTSLSFYFTGLCLFYHRLLYKRVCICGSLSKLLYVVDLRSALHCCSWRTEVSMGILSRYFYCKKPLFFFNNIYLPFYITWYEMVVSVFSFF